MAHGKRGFCVVKKVVFGIFSIFLIFHGDVGLGLNALNWKPA